MSFVFTGSLIVIFLLDTRALICYRIPLTCLAQVEKHCRESLLTVLQITQAERLMVHAAQRAALVCDAAPDGDLDSSRDMTISINLQGIRSLNNSCHTIYLRYSLPTLGYLPAVQTSPPVNTERHGAQSFQTNAFNSFEVALSYRALAAALSTPIQLQVWGKEKYAKDSLIAVGDLHLWLPFAVLGGAGEHSSSQRSWPGGQREWTGLVSAFEVEAVSARAAEKLGVGAVDVCATQRKLFTVSVSLTFDDTGAVKGDPSCQLALVAAKVCLLSL